MLKIKFKNNVKTENISNVATEKEPDNMTANIISSNTQKTEGMNMSNPNEVKMTTGKVVLFRPHINKKWSYDQNTAARFSVIMLTDDVEILKELSAAVDKARIIGKEKFGDNVQFKGPIKCPGFTSGNDSDIYYQNFHSLKATTGLKPGLINENKQEISKSDSDIELHYARVSVSFYPYCFDNGRAGIACKLHNIQVFKEELDMTRYASNPADDF